MNLSASATKKYCGTWRPYRNNKQQNKALHHDCLQFRSFLAPLPAASELVRCVAARGFDGCESFVNPG